MNFVREGEREREKRGSPSRTDKRPRFNCLSPLFLPQLVCAVDLTDTEQTAVSDRERASQGGERDESALAVVVRLERRSCLRVFTVDA